MIARLLDALRNTLEPGEASEDALSGLQRAVAVLLVDVAKSDWNDQPEEKEAITRILQAQFALDASEAQALIGEAEHLQNIEASLHAHLATLIDQWSVPQRIELIDALWSVAYADGELSKYEEHTIRRLANLLHVPHGDFIRTKHRYSDQ